MRVKTRPIVTGHSVPFGVSEVIATPKPCRPRLARTALERLTDDHRSSSGAPGLPNVALAISLAFVMSDLKGKASRRVLATGWLRKLGDGYTGSVGIDFPFATGTSFHCQRVNLVSFQRS